MQRHMLKILAGSMLNVAAARGGLHRVVGGGRRPPRIMCPASMFSICLRMYFLLLPHIVFSALAHIAFPAVCFISFTVIFRLLALLTNSGAGISEIL